MRRAVTLVLILGLAAGLAGCGLQPLYGKGSSDTASVAPELAQIQIAKIDSGGQRTAYLVRNNLLDRLNPRGEPDRPRYRLEIKLLEFPESLAITSSDEATRTNLVMAAQYKLVDLASNRPIHASEVRSITSFNRLRADFGNIAAEQDATQRAARELSESIRAELATWFSRPAVQRQQR